MSETAVIDVTPDMDLEWSLSEADIDEILGKENGDSEGLSESFIDDAIDDLIDNNDRILDDKKSFWKNLFKKEIKKKRLNNYDADGSDSTVNISENLAGTEYESLTQTAFENQITSEDMNWILQDIAPNSVLTEKQSAVFDKDLELARYKQLDILHQAIQQENDIIETAEFKNDADYEKYHETITERLNHVESQLNESADKLQEEYGFTNDNLYHVHEFNNNFLEQSQSDIDQLRFIEVMQHLDDVIENEAPIVIKELEQTHNFIWTGMATVETPHQGGETGSIATMIDDEPLSDEAVDYAVDRLEFMRVEPSFVDFDSRKESSVKNDMIQSIAESPVSPDTNTLIGDNIESLLDHNIDMNYQSSPSYHEDFVDDIRIVHIDSHDEAAIAGAIISLTEADNQTSDKTDSFTEKWVVIDENNRIRGISNESDDSITQSLHESVTYQDAVFNHDHIISTDNDSILRNDAAPHSMIDMTMTGVMPGTMAGTGSGYVVGAQNQQIDFSKHSVNIDYNPTRFNMSEAELRSHLNEAGNKQLDEALRDIDRVSGCNAEIDRYVDTYIGSMTGAETYMNLMSEYDSHGNRKSFAQTLSDSQAALNYYKDFETACKMQNKIASLEEEKYLVIGAHTVSSLNRDGIAYGKDLGTNNHNQVIETSGAYDNFVHQRLQTADAETTKMDQFRNAMQGFDSKIQNFTKANENVSDPERRKIIDRITEMAHGSLEKTAKSLERHEMVAATSAKIADKFKDLIARGDDNEAGRGLNDVRNNFIYRTLRDGLSGAGAKSAYAMLAEKNSIINSYALKMSETMMDSPGFKGIDSHLRIADLKSLSKSELKESLKKAGYSNKEIHAILKHRKDIADNLSLQKNLADSMKKYPTLYSAEQSNVVLSKGFFDSKNNLHIQKAMNTYLKTSGVDAGLVTKLSSLNEASYKKFLQSKMGRSLTVEQKMMLKYSRDIKALDLAKNKTRGSIGIIRGFTRNLSRQFMQETESGSLMMQSAMIARQIRQFTSISGKAGAYILKSVRVGTRTAFHVVRGGGRLVGKVGKASFKGMVKLINKIPGASKYTRFMSNISRTLGRNVSAFMRGVGRVATAPARAIKRATGGITKVVNKRASQKQAKRMFKSFKKEQRKAAVKNGIQNIGKAFSRNLSKTAAGRAALKAGRGVKKATKITGQILSAPFKFLKKIIGGIFSIVNKIKLVILAVIAYVAKVWMKLAFISLVLFFITSSIDEYIMFMTEEAHAARESYNSIIAYPDRATMEGDVNHYEDLEDERYDLAVEMGEGEPQNPEALYGHTIDAYGSPDTAIGYTIHYLDGNGREIASESSNIKDVLSVAAMMCANQIQDTKDGVKNYQALVEDLYEMMNPDYHPGEDPEWQFDYEESDIYVCEHGNCDWHKKNGHYDPDLFEYECDDISKYYEWDAMIDAGCGHYEDLEPYNPDGCYFDEDSYNHDHDYWENWWNKYGIDEPDIDYYRDYYEDESDAWDAYYQAWDEYNDFVDDYNDWEPKPDDEAYHYCIGHQTPTCYGHKDIDIYITLYSIQDAADKNLIPENWELKPYAYMIRNFINAGGWDNGSAIEFAYKYYNADWFELYGFDIDGSAGFVTVQTLSNADIEAILAKYSGDADEARKDLAEFALQYVGKIPYYYGGHDAVAGYDGNNFGTAVAPDEKGRTRKGLDCSGFVQWVYNSAWSASLPNTTAGYTGYSTKDKSQLNVGDLGFKKVPGSDDNHVGIYIGQDKNGRDLWVHATGQPVNTVVVDSFNFQYFIGPMD